ncbi:MAG: NAD(P)-dependent glycerol-3-phosphate dehydrogenase [Sandarakinorhabdus sp.]|nr:NAD(P)-dependent glycerol-3-phosphate dehydrogenase [Sandarakinorhabdus sp.]
MIAIVGGGAWGTALAQVMASGEDELLGAGRPVVVTSINAAHENKDFLPGIRLNPAVRATGNLAELAAADVWLVVVPAQHLRGVLVAAPLAGRPTLVLCAKGIEAGSLKLMAEVVADVSDAPVAVLSGPTFAAEVARGLPTAVTLAIETGAIEPGAAGDAAVGDALVQRLARPAFRPYLSDDITGAEIGGAVKNVLAIACGVVEGAGLGLNARAALIARGFAEMTRFGLARGARAETLAGLSGLGDLVLTCSSANSRNFTLGLGIGRGERAAELLAATRTVAEGASTAPVLVAAARAAGVEMPIAEAVAALIAGAPLRETVAALLARPLKAE